MAVFVRVSDAKTLGNWEIEHHSLLGTMVCYVDIARNGTFPGHGDYSLAQREIGVCWARWFVWRTEREMRTPPRHACYVGTGGN